MGSFDQNGRDHIAECAGRLKNRSFLQILTKICVSLVEACAKLRYLTLEWSLHRTGQFRSEQIQGEICSTWETA